MLIGRPSQVRDDIDIKINDVRIEQVQSMKYLGIYIDNKLSWDVQCDKLCSNVAGKISVLRRISLHLIMPALCGATQNKATSQNYNGLKTTLLELLLETLIMSISEVLIYYMSSTGHQLKRDVIILHR